MAVTHHLILMLHNWRYIRFLAVHVRDLLHPDFGRLLRDLGRPGDDRFDRVPMTAAAARCS